MRVTMSTARKISKHFIKLKPVVELQKTLAWDSTDEQLLQLHIRSSSFLWSDNFYKAEHSTKRK